MLQSEQAWTGQFYNGMEFNTREGAEDFVSAMQPVEPNQLPQMEPLLRPRAVEDSQRPLMRFGPCAISGVRCMGSRPCAPCATFRAKLHKIDEHSAGRS
jgi:hypothetical protein